MTGVVPVRFSGIAVKNMLTETHIDTLKVHYAEDTAFGFKPMHTACHSLSLLQSFYSQDMVEGGIFCT